MDVTLYFLSGSGTLAGEKRTLSLYEGQTLAESLASALLEGPENRELSRVIPEGFSFNYVRVDSGYFPPPGCGWWRRGTWLRFCR